MKKFSSTKRSVLTYLTTRFGDVNYIPDLHYIECKDSVTPEYPMSTYTVGYLSIYAINILSATVQGYNQ